MKSDRSAEVELLAGRRQIHLESKSKAPLQRGEGKTSRSAGSDRTERFTNFSFVLRTSLIRREKKIKRKRRKIKTRGGTSGGKGINTDSGRRVLPARGGRARPGAPWSPFLLLLFLLVLSAPALTHLLFAAVPGSAAEPSVPSQGQDCHLQ